MVSVYTPNINLEEPARGDQVGTWDTPVNANMTLIDLVVGGTAAVPLAGAPVVLAAAQFQAKTIVFSSTLTASVTITLPTSFTKSYEIYNQCTGSSAFTVTLRTTLAGGAAVCCPPGEIVDVSNIGGNMFFKNLGRVGQYWDHGGSSVPAWVSGCSVPPYLTCNGGGFSSATYPILTHFLGGTNTPDTRGRSRFALNEGTGRVTGAISGLDGNTLGSGGGSESLTAHTHVNTLTDPGHFHFGQFEFSGAGGGVALTAPAGAFALDQKTGTKVTGVTITNVSAGAGAAQNVPPAYIGGICMIRAG